MNLSVTYLAAVFNSTLRYMTPILLVSLCAGVCSKSRVFNIGLEGTLLISAFVAFLVQYKYRNIYLAVLSAMLAAMLVTFIIAFFIVRLNAHSMIVGMAVNTFAMGFTTFLLQVVFKTKGVVSDPTLQGLPKVDAGFLGGGLLSSMFGNLTVLDYAAFVLAILMYLLMYKTVLGFRIRCIGINPDAAASLGIRVQRWQILATTLSGSLIGLAGCLLSLGSVTMFIQNISAARGYVALAANNLCQGHPLGALASSALFGFTTALAQVLQNSALKQQLLNCIPYIATIAAMAVYNGLAARKAKK
ncbi:MAG: ABC transporter permease [Oscillospiraceae bacterium]|nr:ABC transporter permease [Oscillospiraceae bacterium]